MQKQEWIDRLGSLPRNMEITTYGLIYRDPIATAPTVEREQYDATLIRDIRLGDYTLKNLTRCRELLASDEIKNKIAGWAKTQADYRRSKSYLIARKKYEARELAMRAGLEHDEHGGYRRGDYHTLIVLDVIWQPAKLRTLHASGDILALVIDCRKRIYAKSYGHGPGERTDVYLVGTNESGTPFCHAVAQHLLTVADAVDWVWWGNEPITARHGDVAITPTRKPIKNGELVNDLQIVDRHVITGEVYRNGALYARNAVLHHTADQHPDITIGNEWHKIIIGRRSTRRPSSKD